MSRMLFTNSRAALAFAAATLVAAVAMVGTSEDDGVIPAVVEKLNETERADRPVAAPPAPPPPVFGDYVPEAPAPRGPVAPAGDPAPASGAYTEVIISPTGEAIPIERDEPSDALR